MNIPKPVNDKPLKEVPGTIGLDFGQEVTAYIPTKGKIAGYTIEDGRTKVLVQTEKGGAWLYTPEDLGGKTLGAKD